MDWVSRALRRIIEFTQGGGEVNVVVAGINVGAQPYWNAEATMLMKVQCASHFVSFEHGRHLLYRATQEWLASGTVDGAARGEFFGDVKGRVTRAPA